MTQEKNQVKKQILMKEEMIAGEVSQSYLQNAYKILHQIE